MHDSGLLFDNWQALFAIAIISAARRVHLYAFAGVSLGECDGHFHALAFAYSSHAAFHIDLAS